MVRNRIKVMRAEVGISATALADRMPDVDKVAMSYIEQGRVLPTRESMETMCDVFNCFPTDIYEANDIDLKAVKRVEPEPQETVKVKAAKANRSIAESIKEFDEEDVDRQGQAQLRVWMMVDEKAALFRAVKGLGYHSVAEWLREMYRETIHKYITLNLKETEQLHNAVPLTTDNQTIRS